MSVKKPNKRALAYLRRIGINGGKARAASLTPERRSEIARNAYAARKDRQKPVATVDSQAKERFPAEPERTSTASRTIAEWRKP